MGNSDRFRGTGLWLLSHEAGGCASATNLAKAGASVLDQLEQGLAMLIGRRGARLLLTRALHAARAQHAFLGAYRDSLAAEGVLEGLPPQVGGMDPSEVHDGIAAIVAEALSFLSDFIGQDLVIRQIRRIWPELPAEELRLPDWRDDEPV